MIADNPLDLSSWQRHDVEHVGMFLYEHFNHHWPETAHIYAGTVAKENDVTPHGEESIETLEAIQEPLWVVVYPATGVEVAITLGVVALVASVAAILLIPDVPTATTPKEREGLTGSPNNSLSRRQNEARPGQRIPAIFGFQHVIPDMIMVPYIRYVNHRETELGYYCIGEGIFDIDEARDGDTLVEEIDGASCHVYSPGNAPTGTGPFSGDLLALGADIDDPVKNVYEIKSINGQSLIPFNANTLYGAAKKTDKDGGYSTLTVYNFFNVMSFRYLASNTGVIYVPWLKNPQHVHDRIQIGDKIYLRWDTSDLPTTGQPKPDLQTTSDEPFDNAMTVTGIMDEGDFVLLAVSIPAALTTEWEKMPDYCNAGSDVRFNRFGTSIDFPHAEVTTLRDLFIGPFFADFEHPVGASNPTVLVNFVAPSGLYAEDGTTIQKLDFVVTLGVTPCDISGTPTGAEVFYDSTLTGSDVSANLRALSFEQALPFSGRFLLRVRRTTRSLRKAELPTFVELDNYGGFKAYTGRVTDEIRVTHAYSMSEPPNISFGGVTTVHTQTINTNGATRLRARELNLLVHRLIQTWNGSIFGGSAVRDARAENVLFTIMKDLSIGARSDAEIDFTGIVAAMSAVRAYFNDSNTGNLATQISITIDDANLSFEEIATLIANAAFCTIYRLGNVLKCKPEIDTDLAVVALNHRNILPGTQRITHTFGPPTEHDSVEVGYNDPLDNTLTSVRVPFDVVTYSPKDVRVLGLGTRKQAIWHAYRAYQRILFQRQAAEMQTTQEGGLVLIRDRVLMADVTVADKQSGEIVAVSGLNIKLSQKPTLAGGKTYTIFLQHRDGTVEGIAVTAGSGFFDLVLAGAPSVSIVTNPALGVPTIYTLVVDDETLPFAYMISEMSARDNMVFNISAINFSHLYYFGDSLDMWAKGNTSSIADWSPAERNPIQVDHTFPVVSEPVRGNMLDCDGSNSFNVDFTQFNDALDVDGGYSVFAWVKHNTSTAGYTGISQSVDDVTVLFGFFDDDVAAGHNGSLQVQATPPTPGTLHSMGVTWEPVSGRMALFVNGIVVDTATVAAPTTPHGHVYAKQYDGLLGDLVRYRRCLTDQAMMELHLKTKL